MRVHCRESPFVNRHDMLLKLGRESDGPSRVLSASIIRPGSRSISGMEESRNRTFYFKQGRKQVIKY